MMAKAKAVPMTASFIARLITAAAGARRSRSRSAETRYLGLQSEADLVERGGGHARDALGALGTPHRAPRGAGGARQLSRRQTEQSAGGARIVDGDRIVAAHEADFDLDREPDAVALAVSTFTAEFREITASKRCGCGLTAHGFAGVIVPVACPSGPSRGSSPNHTSLRYS